MVIKRQTKACVLFTLAWLAITVFGCGAWQSRQGFKSVPVSSFDAIAAVRTNFNLIDTIPAQQGIRLT